MTRAAIQFDLRFGLRTPVEHLDAILETPVRPPRGPIDGAAINYAVDADTSTLFVRLEGHQSVGELIMTARFLDALPGLPSHLKLVVDASATTNRIPMQGLETLIYTLTSLPRLTGATIAIVVPHHSPLALEYSPGVRAYLARVQFEVFRTREGAAAWLNLSRAIPTAGWSSISLTAATRATLLGWRLD